MLKFLTDKLRTHSLNEENPLQKVENDDHDSGTESDDEHADIDNQETSMEDSSETEVEMCNSTEASIGSVRYNDTVRTLSPYFVDSALPSDSDLNYDHHSSEEELEVINNSCCTGKSSPAPSACLQQQGDHLLSNATVGTDIKSPVILNDISTDTINIHQHKNHNNFYQHHLLPISSSNSRNAENRSCSSQNIVINSNSDISNSSSNFNDNNSKCVRSVSNISRVDMNNSMDDGDIGRSAVSSSNITRSRSTSTLPEKRKWSQVTLEPLSTSKNCDNGYSGSIETSIHSPTNYMFRCLSVGVGRNDISSGSSDDEVQGLLSTPVQFRTSPPRGAHRPGRSFSPPPKLFHYSTGQDSSPRKRHRHATAHTIQRPCLDFEKMQQLKARSVTAWRSHSGDHGGELSVFCW